MQDRLPSYYKSLEIDKRNLIVDINNLNKKLIEYENKGNENTY